MECNVCGAQFTRLVSLVGHIKKHDIRIACVVCGKMVHPNAIELHAKVHTNDKPCLSCGKIIHAGRNKTRNKFCSRRCAAKVNNTKRRKKSPINSGKCLNCGKEILRRNVYCSVNCQKERKFRLYIADWLDGKVSGNINGIMDLAVSSYVRRWLIEKRGERCERCGWHEKNPYNELIPLAVHHKDGDATHTVPDNIELLCPNCHSLTKTYGSLNRGNGRIGRRARYAKQKQAILNTKD